jgi:hypothetical protein
VEEHLEESPQIWYCRSNSYPIWTQYTLCALTFATFQKAPLFPLMNPMQANCGPTPHHVPTCVNDPWMAMGAGLLRIRNDHLRLHYRQSLYKLYLADALRRAPSITYTLIRLLLPRSEAAAPHTAQTLAMHDEREFPQISLPARWSASPYLDVPLHFLCECRVLSSYYHPQLRLSWAYCSKVAVNS